MTDKKDKKKTGEKFFISDKLIPISNYIISGVAVSLFIFSVNVVSGCSRSISSSGNTSVSNVERGRESPDSNFDYTLTEDGNGDIQSVQNAPVMFADVIVKIYFDKIIGTEDEITVGRILNNRLSYSLPSSLDDKYLINPIELGAYDITDGMRISMIHFDPKIILYRYNESYNVHSEYRYFYSNIKGSYKINDQIYELYKGWNFLRCDYWWEWNDNGDLIVFEEYVQLPPDTYIHDLYMAGFYWYAEDKSTYDSDKTDETWWLE